MSFYTKISRYGPGGRKCHCCSPGPSFRKKHDRMVKRRERQQYLDEIRQSLNINDIDEEEKDITI